MSGFSVAVPNAEFRDGRVDNPSSEPEFEF
jgi:hypothetical protein